MCNVFYSYFCFLVGVLSLGVKQSVESVLMGIMNVEIVLYSRSYGRSGLRLPDPVASNNIGRTVVAFEE